MFSNRGAIKFRRDMENEKGSDRRIDRIAFKVNQTNGGTMMLDVAIELNGFRVKRLDMPERVQRKHGTAIESFIYGNFMALIQDTYNVCAKLEFWQVEDKRDMDAMMIFAVSSL